MPWWLRQWTGNWVGTVAELCWRSLILDKCPAREVVDQGTSGSVKICQAIVPPGALDDAWGTEVEATTCGALSQPATFSLSCVRLPGVQVWLLEPHTYNEPLTGQFCSSGLLAAGGVNSQRVPSYYLVLQGAARRQPSMSRSRKPLPLVRLGPPSVRKLQAHACQVASHAGVEIQILWRRNGPGRVIAFPELAAQRRIGDLILVLGQYLQ